MDVISYIRNQRYLKALLRTFLTARENKIMLRLRQIRIEPSQSDEKNELADSKTLHKDKVSSEYIDQFFKLEEVKILL